MRNCLDLPAWEAAAVAQALRELKDKLWVNLGSEWLPTKGSVQKEAK